MLLVLLLLLLLLLLFPVLVHQAAVALAVLGLGRHFVWTEPMVEPKGGRACVPSNTALQQIRRPPSQHQSCAPIEARGR